MEKLSQKSAYPTAKSEKMSKTDKGKSNNAILKNWNFEKFSASVSSSSLCWLKYKKYNNFLFSLASNNGQQMHTGAINYIQGLNK